MKWFESLFAAVLPVTVLLLGCTTEGSHAIPADAPKRVINSIGMEMVLIPAGEFYMGSFDTEDDARDDEKPRHRVRITKPFYMGVYEVTQEQVGRVLGPHSNAFSLNSALREEYAVARGEDSVPHLPAEQLKWTDAREFCQKLSARPEERAAGRAYRLPTEAEWEYACRAGTETVFHHGDSLSSKQANFNGANPYGSGEVGPFRKQTTPVGTFAPNAFGLYDMHGNLWEWCMDWYAVDGYKSSSTEDPRGPASGTSRVIRSGAWYSDASDCRCAFRYADHPQGIYYELGFRVVMVQGVPGTPPPKLFENDVPTEISYFEDGSPVEPELFEGEDWPRWRGVRGDGTWQGPDLPDEWPGKGLRTIWRRDLGEGYAGISVSGDLAYTMDHLSEPTERERVICYDRRNGEELWVYSYPVEYGDLPYGNGPRVTPTVVDGVLYAVGALGDTYALDSATGEKRWELNVREKFGAPLPLWGFSAAPLLFEELVILHIGGRPDASVVALDRASGAERWRSLSDPAGYALPVIIESGGTEQLIQWTPAAINGLDPRTGVPYWAVPFKVHNGVSITTPLFREGVVLVSGYWEGSKAVRLGETPEAVEDAWTDRRLRSLMAQGLYLDGYGYLLDRRNGLNCFEMKSGARKWNDDNRVTPKGRNPQATMVHLKGTALAFVLNSDGQLVLVRLNPESYHEVGRTDLIAPAGPSQPIWAHPAYAGQCVYARSDKEIVCVSLMPRK